MQLLQRFPALRDWADRMAAIGHGHFEPMTSDEALHDVRAAQRDSAWKPAWPTVDDERLGQLMVVTADDYGRDPISGIVSAVSDRHITLTREAPDLGTVRVHFPKVGYELTAAARRCRVGTAARHARRAPRRGHRYESWRLTGAS